MNNRMQKFWSIAVLVIGYLFLGLFLFYSRFLHIRSGVVSELIFWLIMFLYIFFSTCWLFKKKWKNILGLSCKNINRSILLKAFWLGFRVSIITNILTALILIILRAPISFPFSDKTTFLEILFGALLIAPVTEEILFRGFMQGILQKHYASNRQNKHIKTIIVLTSFLFTIAHIRYIIYTETLQWVLSFLGIFIVSLYLGNLRNKYQSIIPSMFAHLGANSMVGVGAIFMLIFMGVSKPANFKQAFLKEFCQKESVIDSLCYFDTNKAEELTCAHKQFYARYNSPHPELKTYFPKGQRSIIIPVWYDIDTVGLISNIRIYSDFLKELYENKHISKEIEKEALRLVSSFPQHKPFIEEGKKKAVTRAAYVPIYY